MLWDRLFWDISSQSEISGTKLVPTNTDLKKEIWYFQEKYKGRVIHTMDITREHPYVTEILTGLQKHVIWQDKAKKALANAVVDCIYRIGEIKWPIGTFFFSWPTWVGKTEMVKWLAEVLFWDSNAFIKIEWEQLRESHNGSKVFGSPPWFVGSDKPPKLTNKAIMLHADVAKKMKKLNKMVSNLPWISILLVDEADKIHPDILQQFLSIMDDGKVTVSNGEVVNLQNTLIIFTSNVWQKEISAFKSKNVMWFWEKQVSEKDLHKILQESLKQMVSPEFLWRVWNFIDFDELTTKDSKDIIDIEVIKLNKYLLKYFSEAHVQFELSPAVYDLVIKEWYSKEKWARELSRTFQKLVKRSLQKMLFSDEFVPYYEYKGPVLIGFDINDKNQVVSEIILWEEEFKTKPILLLENKTASNMSKFDLQKLNEIYTVMSAYTELVYLTLDQDIDMKQELGEYAEKLKWYGLSTQDLVHLRERAYLEWLRDLIFLQDFEWIHLWDEERDLFHPYEPRVMMKIVEKIMEKEYKSGRVSKKKFIVNSTKSIVAVVTQLFSIWELSGSQTNQLLIYIRKVMVEKYGIHSWY